MSNKRPKTIREQFNFGACVIQYRPYMALQQKEIIYVNTGIILANENLYFLCGKRQYSLI